MDAMGTGRDADGRRSIGVPLPEPAEGEVLGAGETPVRTSEQGFDRGATTITTAVEPASHEER